MAESRQHTLDRVRKPRVHITYDVEIGNAIEVRELPFIVGVMADLSGHPENPLPKLKERKFVEIDRDNFLEVMSVISPRLVIKVPNRIDDSTPEMGMELIFKTMDDFEPQNLVRHVPKIGRLFQKRTNFKNLISKMDGNDDLELLLTQIMKDKDTLMRLLQEVQEYDEEHHPQPAEEEAAPPAEA